MTVHRWFAPKACPGDYLYQRMGDIAAKANAINNTSNVTVKVEEEDEDMTQEVFNKHMTTYLNTMAKQPATFE